MSWNLYARLRPVGTPKAQPRVKAFSRGNHAGVYTPETAKSWKQLVMIEAAPYAGRQIDGPVRIDIVFFLPRPKAHRKEVFVVTKPDIDNLVKSTTDALTDCAVWRDDSQIVRLETGKFYACDEKEVGAEIKIYSWVKGGGR